MKMIDRLKSFGATRGYKLADLCLVFMLRGLYRAWMQTLAFFFVQSAAITFDLKSCIEQVGKTVHEKTKFFIVASVIDLGSTNRSAVYYFYRII